MWTRMMLVVFLAFTAAGCVTGSKKQTTQLQPVVPRKTPQQESYYEDTRPSDNYALPQQKTYPATAVQLSPKQISPGQIQRALKNAGFYDGPIDGKIGPKTKTAIIKFQKAKGLKADGIVGKRTTAELNKYLSR